jgi:hypothetical protein
VPSSGNRWEATARTEKAQKLVAALVAHGIDAATAARLDRAAWRDVARAARVHPPSDETIAVAVDLYRLRTARAAAAEPF